MNRKAKVLITVLIIIILGVGGVFGYIYFYKPSDNKTATQSLVKITSTPTPTATPTTSSPDTMTAGWKTYTDSTNKYSVKYPSDWYIIPIAKQSDNPYTIYISPVNSKPTDTPLIGLCITVYSKGYLLPQDGITKEYLSESTDLTYFIRIMNGLLPDESFNTVHKETKSIGEVEAIKYTRNAIDGDYNTPWIIKRGAEIYSFNIVGTETTIQSVANRILSTLKFI